MIFDLINIGNETLKLNSIAMTHTIFGVWILSDRIKRVFFIFCRLLDRINFDPKERIEQKNVNIYSTIVVMNKKKCPNHLSANKAEKEETKDGRNS